MATYKIVVTNYRQELLSEKETHISASSAGKAIQIVRDAMDPGSLALWDSAMQPVNWWAEDTETGEFYRWNISMRGPILCVRALLS